MATPLPTIEELITRVRELAAQSPDNVYDPEKTVLGEQCYYKSKKCSNGSVGCIIGQALGDAMTGEIEGDVTNVLEALSIKSNKQQRAWCKEVQYRQDSKKTWGEAVHQADVEHPLGVSS